MIYCVRVRARFCRPLCNEVCHGGQMLRCKKITHQIPTPRNYNQMWDKKARPTLWVKMISDKGQFRDRIKKDSKKGNKNITCTYRAIAFPRKMGHERESIKMSL